MRRVDAKRLVFLDESGAKTNMTRLYGRALCGQRVLGQTPHGHWHTTTILSAIRFDAVAAAMVIEGATDRLVFEGFVEFFLVPVLRPGDIVVLDNLSSHKGVRIEELIQSADAELRYLPPYSPDLNPIEQMYSKVKAYLRQAAARTKRRLINAVGRALRTVTENDVANWTTNCGYRNRQK